jgi:NADH-quinone oxidoreductase subunit E
MDQTTSPLPQGVVEETEEEKREHVRRVIRDFRGKPGSLIQILHIVQELYGFLPMEVQREVGEALDIPVSEVYGVSTFYSFFTQKPRGEHTIRVCLGTACYVRGGQKICKRLQQMLGVDIGETTPDNKFTLEVMRCIGACGLAPAMTIDDAVLRQVNPDKLGRLLAKHQ